MTHSKLILMAGIIMVLAFSVEAEAQTGVVSLALGAAHTCIVTSDGGVKCWGQGSLGQLGDGTTMFRITPVDVIGL